MSKKRNIGKAIIFNANNNTKTSKKRNIGKSIIFNESENTKTSQQKSQQQAVNDILLPEVKDGKLSLDGVAKVGGFESAAEQQRYKKQNPNLSAVMGGTKYNPVPHVNPTVLTDEGEEIVKQAMEEDKFYRDTGHQPIDFDGINKQIMIDNAVKKFKNGEALTISELATVAKAAEDMAEESKTPVMDTTAFLKYLSSGITESAKAKKDNPTRQEAKNVISEFNDTFSNVVYDLFVPKLLRESHKANVVDTVEKYLNQDDQELYYKKLSISQKEADIFLNSKSDEIAIKRGYEMAERAKSSNAAAIELYILQGLETTAKGFANTLLLARGETVTENSAVEYANYFLQEYYTENEYKGRLAVQNIVTNLAQNLSAGAFGTGGFAFSVFGNAYSDAVKEYGEGKTMVYALANTTLEVGLEKLLGNLPGVGGLFADNASDILLKNITNGFIRTISRLGIGAFGETIEEGLQRLIDPFTRNIILGETNDTIFTNPWGELKDAGYEAAIAAVCGLVFSGINEISIKNEESNLIKKGAAYKEILRKLELEVKDLANYGFAISEKGSQTHNFCDSIISKKTKATDLNVGKLCDLISQEIGSINTAINSMVGERVKSESNGVSNIVANYDNLTAQGAVFPATVAYEVEKIREALASGQEIETSFIGKTERDVKIYSVRAMINSELQSEPNNKSSNLQSTANDGIIDSVGDNNVDGRTTETSVKEIRERYFKKATEDIGRGVEETAESFAERTSRIGIEGNGGARRLRIKDGKSSIAFAISKKDTPISRFVSKLKAVGIDAYFCEGPIETNANGVTYTRYEAFTTASGKIFFSDSANLPGKEIVDHELVHNLLRQLNDDYFVYEDILVSNLNRESNYYIAFCLELNEREFNNKFEISEEEFSISGASAFNSEILAYVYQKVLNNRPFADEFFSNMFYNWSEVVEAVYTLNSKMKIDTSELSQADSNSEPASFMPENETQGGFELTEFDIREEKVDWVQSIGDEVAKYDRKTADQRALFKAAQKLGWKVGFANVYKRDEKNRPIRDENGNYQRANARVNKSVKEIVFDYNCQTPIRELIKHELTHFLETNVATYQDFANAVMNSKAFKTWVRTNGYESTTDYNLAIRQTYNGAKGFENESNAENSANLEMVANFVAANLFSNEQAMLDRLVAELNPAQRSKLNEIVHKLLTALKNAFAGMTQEGEIQKLENKWIETYKKAETAWQEKQEAGDQTDKSKNEYSFALEKDTSLISKAEQMEQKGVNRDEIWEELRIIRDIDGAWVCEIDDSEMKFYPEGDVFIKDDPEYKEFKHLDRLDKMTTKQIERYADLEDRFMLQYGYGPWLKNYLVHDKLYAKFPHLKETVLQVVPDSKDYSGYYDPNTNTIAITENVMYGDKIRLNKTVIHEIQHALQTFEDRENGANVEFWNARILSGKAPTHPITGDKLSAKDAYWYTAGEIEAREASERYELYDEWRKFVAPDFGWDYAIRAGKLPAAVNKEYINAVENGNIEEAQQIVDTVARATGYTERLYHQTNADFTEFNTDNQKAGKYDWELPTGTFLKPTDSDIGLSGKKQMELYANIRNPLVFANRYAAQKFWSENIKGYSEAAQTVKDIDIEYREKTDRAINEVQAYKKNWRAENPDADSRELYNDLEFQRLDGQEERIIEEWERKSDEASLKAKKLIDDFIASNDYDGIIIERDQGSFGRSTKTYIVFDSSQLKDASPVTRDDNGNVIALSERFNKSKRDIRYLRPIQSSVDNNNDDGVQYSITDEFKTNAMSWANEANRQDGDVKILNRNGKEFVLIVANGKGAYAEVATGKYNEVKEEYDRQYTENDLSLHRNLEEFRSIKGRNDSDSNAYRGKTFDDDKDSRFIGSKGVQTYTARNNEHLRTSNRRNGIQINSDVHFKSGKNINDLKATSGDEVAFSMPQDEYSIAVEKENPKTIADLTEFDALTTPPLERKQGIARGNRQSKTYESLLGSDIFDETFKKEVESDEFIRKYQSIGNEKTMREAAQELDEGGQQYVNSWWNLEPQRASLIDTAVGFILMDRYQRVGDYESAIAVAEKVREFGTASGQQVQIFSILGRLDANSMVVYAQKELSKAFETMVEGRTKAWINKNAERFQLTDDDIEFIRRHTLQAAQLPEGRDKAIRLAEISALLQDKLPAEKGQAIKAYQRIAMLLNVKTNIRNFVGNLGMVPVFVFSDVFGSGIDRFVSKKTGVRTTGNFDIKSVKGFKKGAFETIDDFRRHINTRNEEMNRFDIGSRSGKSFNENNTGKLAKQLNDCARVLNALDRFTSFCLELGDRPFYEMWLLNSINNQMKLNKVSEPTPEMIVIASNEALQRTWQDSNKIVDMVSKSKNVLNKISINGYGLGDVLIKFTKTPANLTKAIFDFSPAGFIKSLAVDSRAFNNSLQTGQFTPEIQKRFVDTLSKGIAGTLLYILAFGLASAGMLSGGSDDDKDVANFEKYIQGIPPYSVKLFGKWYSYEWMQPIGAISASVTDYMKARKESVDNKWYDDVLLAVKAGGEVLYNQSFMKSIQNLFTADNVIDGIIDLVLDEPSVFVPQMLSQLANATDKYRRTTYEPNDAFKTALNNIKYKIPGLRQTLEKQVDVLGREVPNSQYGMINAFLNPANTYTDTSNDTTDEVYNLYKQTGKLSVIPRTAPNYVEVKGTKIKFSAEQKMDFQRSIGKRSAELLDKLFASDEYQDLSESQKVSVVEDIYSFATAVAKSELKYDYETLSAMIGENSNGKPYLSESDYKKLSTKAKKEYAKEYFLSKTEMKYINNYESLISHYIKQSK